MKVTLKEWNAIATWHWDMPEDEVCGICRVQFDGTCPTCKFPGDDCSLRESTCFPIPRLGTYYICSTWQMRPLVSYGETEHIQENCDLLANSGSTALPDDLDPARNIQGTVSDVSPEYDNHFTFAINAN